MIPNNIIDAKKTLKPWGYEILWAKTDDYVSKFLYIEPNQRLSLQFHEKKEETVCVMTGVLLLWEQKNQKEPEILGPGSIYHVKPGQIHRFGASLEPVSLIEVSTNYLEDVVRLQDDYRRNG